MAFLAHATTAKQALKVFVASTIWTVLAESQAETGFLATRSHAQVDILHELEQLAGRDHRLAAEKRVDRLEEALRPMLLSMPRDGHGRLDAAGVRYVLHRLFVQRHGWFVRGLADGRSDGWNSSSPAAVFDQHAEAHGSFFQEKLDNQAFSLRQVAVFAATLETLVHGENQERLSAAYRVLGLSQTSTLSEKQASEVVRAYMVLYTILEDANLTTLPVSKFRRVYDNVHRYYKTFSDTETFADGIRVRIWEDAAVSERTSWDTALKVVEEIGERYGRWQDKECRALKRTMLGMEKPGTARVRLDTFYANTLSDRQSNFVESVPYLRQLGALDDTDPLQMTVVIPNYINSPTNCVAGSKFYSVCCIDECEALLGSLENQIAAPDATANQIAEIVAALPSDTVQAPRTLPSLLTQRLADIAAHHGGRLPLHGRLFAQWMHHAYPHECPYPHVSGTIKPVTAVEWINNTRTSHKASHDDVRALLAEAALSDESAQVDAEEALPWSVDEELFVSRPKLTESQSSTSGPIKRVLALLVAPFSVIIVLVRSYAQGISAAGHKHEKYYV